MIEPKVPLTAETKAADVVAGVADPGSANESTETAVNDRGYNLPNSRKIYIAGELHPELRVPFREISLAPTKTMSGEIEVNEPVLGKKSRDAPFVRKTMDTSPFRTPIRRGETEIRNSKFEIRN